VLSFAAIPQRQKEREKKEFQILELLNFRLKLTRSTATQSREIFSLPLLSSQGDEEEEEEEEGKDEGEAGEMWFGIIDGNS